MNYLFFGSIALFRRFRNESIARNWHITPVGSATEILNFAGTHTFKAAFVELGANQPDARDAIRSLRELGDVPVIVGVLQPMDLETIEISGRDDVDVEVVFGTNDALPLRQCEQIIHFANGIAGGSVTCGAVTYNAKLDEFTAHGQEIRFSPKRHEVLKLLFLRKGRIVTSDAIMDHLYGWEDPPQERIVDVFVCLIRKQMREAGVDPSFIETVWGRGYLVRSATSKSMAA